MSAFYDYVRGVSDAVPEGYTAQGMAVYRYHVYIGASQMVEAQYPTLKAALSDADWRTLMQDFIAKTQWSSHFYADLTQDFQRYLNNEMRGVNGIKC